MALPKLEGRITVPTGGWSLSLTETGGVTAQTVTVPAGNYYLTTSNGGNSALLTVLDTQLEAIGDGTYTVTVDDNSDTSLGKVTITETAGTVSAVAITWTSTSLRDALGFTGNLSGAETFTGGNQARWLWLPNSGRAGANEPDPTSASHTFGRPSLDRTRTMAPSGSSKTLVYNTRYFVDPFGFQWIRGSKAYIQHESTTNESFQRFYLDTVANGYPWKYHPSRDSDTVVFEVEPEQGEFLVTHAAGNQGANGLYNVGPYRVWKKV